MPSAGRIGQPRPRHITACPGSQTREMTQNQRNPFIARTVGRWQATNHAQVVRGSGTSPLGWGLDCIPEMEPKMSNLKVLSMAAALALVLPLAIPSESFAQFKGGGGGSGFRGGGAVGVGGGGGAFRGGGASMGGAMAGAGGFRAAAPAAGGGAAFAGSRFSGGSPAYVGGSVRSPTYSG